MLVMETIAKIRRAFSFRRSQSRRFAASFSIDGASDAIAELGCLGYDRWRAQCRASTSDRCEKVGDEFTVTLRFRAGFHHGSPLAARLSAPPPLQPPPPDPPDPHHPPTPP